MQNIINSFKAHLYERTSSPILGAFIFYWIIFNYKLLIVIFSDLKPIDKFNEINASVYSTWIEQLGYGLLLPVIVTLIYILYLPLITNKIQKKWIEHQNSLKKINNERVLTKKEFGDLQRRFTELELSFDDTFTKKDDEIIRLKQLLDDKDNLLIKYKDEVKEVENSYYELEDKYQKDMTEYKNLKKGQNNIEIENENEKIDLMNSLLIKISNTDYYDLKKVAREFKLHKLRADELIKMVVDSEYIQQSQEIRDQNYVEISSLGQKYLLTKNLI